jgi:DNA-binding winged helix-turn-helix (wHTH) protein
MKKIVLIYNSPILLEIFEEIKNKLDFTFQIYTENIINKLDITNQNNYIIISHNSHEIKNLHIVKVPINIKTLLEKINLFFLAKNFSNQSSIKISKYTIDLNSRKISSGKKYLDLTEKEVKLIMFIQSNSVSSLKDIQEKVWNYSSDLETHTVETHIYRLRKKFLKIFNDSNFIKHTKSGYTINKNF